MNTSWELHQYGATQSSTPALEETSIVVWFSKVFRCLFEIVYGGANVVFPEHQIVNKGIVFKPLHISVVWYNTGAIIILIRIMSPQGEL